MTTTNSLNINQSGVVTFDATVGSFSNSVIDEYSVLLGAANNEIVNLTNSESGQILTSQGTGLQPIWVTPMASTTANQINQQIFDTPGTYTYTPSPNLLFAIVECQGGGGSGGCWNGGSYFTGGGGGGYAKSIVQAATIGASQTVTVGAGGSLATSGNNGQSGGTSSFGSIVIGEGGQGGIVGDYVLGGSGTGDLVINGCVGANTIFVTTVGKSFLGIQNKSPASLYICYAPTGYGCGSNSASSFQSPTGFGGGNGIVIVTEFIGN
jgi:hypothetical protein